MKFSKIDKITGYHRGIFNNLRWCSKEKILH